MPIVSDVVQYVRVDTPEQPSAAIVTRVHNETSVNLIVFPFDAEPELGVRGLPGGAELKIAVPRLGEDPDGPRAGWRFRSRT